MANDSLAKEVEDILDNNKDPVESIPLLEKAIKKEFKDDLNIRTILGTCYLVRATRDLVFSEEDLDKGLDMLLDCVNKGSVVAMDFLASFYEEMGHFKEAEMMYILAIQNGSSIALTKMLNMRIKILTKHEK